MDTVFNSRWQKVSSELQEVRSHIDNLQEFANVIDKIILSGADCRSPGSALGQLQSKLSSDLERMLSYQPKTFDVTSWIGDLEFICNRQAMQVINTEDCQMLVNIVWKALNFNGNISSSQSTKE